MMDRLTATNVPGRKIIVTIEMNVIFLLSTLAAIAMLKFALVSAYVSSISASRFHLVSFIHFCLVV